MMSDVLSTVVNETQFGRVGNRLVLAVIIFGGLAYDRFPPARGLALQCPSADRGPADRARRINRRRNGIRT
jgi:hypothetical protein